MSEGEQIGTEEAENLMHQAISNIRRVKDDYPDLTEELESLLESTDGQLACVHLRLGREDESPSLQELAERYGLGDSDA